MWIYRTGAAQPKCSRSGGGGGGAGVGREAAAEGGPLGPRLARVLVGAHPPSPGALITFVLVLREGETSAQTALREGGGAGGGAGRDCLEMGRGGPAGNGDMGRPGRGAVSFGSEADQ